jgi:protein SCO1/2
MIFVSVDPKRDTPERLKEYVEFFHPSIVGRDGAVPRWSPKSPSAMASSMPNRRSIRPGAGTSSIIRRTHSSSPRTGRVVGKIAHATPPDQVVVAISKHLQPTMKEYLAHEANVPVCC